MPSVVSISLWNTRWAFSCIKSGQRCPECRKSTASEPCRRILSKWQQSNFQRTEASILPMPLSTLLFRCRSPKAFVLGRIVELGIGIAILAKLDTTPRPSLIGGLVSSRSSCCYERVAYRAVQGLILLHTAMALSILAFPGFLLSTSPSPKIHILMDPLQRTLTCSVPVAM